MLLSTQPFNHLSVSHIAELEILKFICFLLVSDWGINRQGVVRNSLTLILLTWRI